MAIDLKTCMGCATCVVACKVENRVDERHSRCRIEQRVEGEFPALKLKIFSERCNQCSNAPCVSNCPTGASFYGEGGTVQINAQKCTGCKACIAACPYDARFINETGVAEKCTFCLHRVRDGKEPACVAMCPSRAMHFGPYEEIVKLGGRPLKPEAGTEPNIFYLE